MPRKSTKIDSQTDVQVAEREPGDEGDRKPFPPQRGWQHDNLAGVERLFYSDTEKEIYEAWFKFRDGKPPQKVFDFLKENGYRPQADAPRGGVWPDVEWAWARPTRFSTLSQDRLLHERVFNKVVEMMIAEKGIEVPQKGHVPF